MVIPAVQEQILEDLSQLSAAQQKRAAEMVHSLVSTRPKGGSLEALMAVAGILDEESASEIMAAIDEGCERVDSSEW